MAETGAIVPVERSPTLRATVAHAVEEASRDGWGELHFVYLSAWRNDDPNVARQRERAEDLLDQVAVWAEYDLEETGAGVDVFTSVLGTDEYLFGAEQYAETIREYARERGIDRVIMDPEYAPVGNRTLLQPLEFELASTSLSIEEAPVERPASHERLAADATGPRFAALFGLSLLFYLVLGDVTYWFDWLTGVASALLVAITLSKISLDHDPTLVETPKRLLRMAIYTPVLLFEITKANLVVARVILTPSLPVEPRITRMRVLVGSGLPVTTLANSITLTPGTLTVRARNENLYVHALIPWAREGLFEGSLERWTRYVFYGREAAWLPSPIERDDCAVLQGPEADEPLPVGPFTDGGETDVAPAVVDASRGENHPETNDDEMPGSDGEIDDAEVTDR